MTPFQAEQVDEIVRYVVAAKDTVLLQEDSGHAVTIPVGIRSEEKEQITRKFCKSASGRICAYTPPPQSKTGEPTSRERL